MQFTPPRDFLDFDLEWSCFLFEIFFCFITVDVLGLLFFFVLNFLFKGGCFCVESVLPNVCG